MVKTEPAAAPSGFQLYDVKIRLSGSRDNEARRHGATAPEVMLLGMIHGPDSLAEVRPIEGKFADRTDFDERGRLAAEFEGQNPHKKGFVSRVFGAPYAGQALPRVVPASFKVEGAVSVQHNAPEIESDPVAAALA